MPTVGRSPWRVGIIERMDCAHHLDGRGLCEAMHGHTYKVEVLAHGPAADGAPLDHPRLSVLTWSCLERFDHKDLNKILPLSTCENLSQLIFDELKIALPYLVSVRVWEGHGKWAEASNAIALVNA